METMNDLISREAAIKAICEDCTWLESHGCTEITMAERKQRDADILGELPSAERKGKWITYYHGGTNFSYSCNQCGATAPFLWNSKDQKKTRYCYNCGARMEDPKLNSIRYIWKVCK